MPQLDLLAGLTEPQRQAVTHIEGPLLVLAGPGSGKTRVITHRVAYMIAQGVKPWHILAITFTNKAAEEMRHRLAAMGLPSGATVGTFHALCARLLRQFADKAGLSPSFSIYDDADQKAAIKAALDTAELDSKNFPPARILNQISQQKNDLVSPDDLAQRGDDFLTTSLVRIYRAYQKQLSENNALDFDDLLMRLALLLRDDPELRDRLNSRYQYVLVDEYQDTNHCQYQIARGLALAHGNLCVTGDPDQSIYSWRGADIGNILAFEEDYPNAAVIRLEENFRSTPQILTLADELIRVNVNRKHKTLFTSLPAGAAPQAACFENEYQEAAGVAEYLRAAQRDGVAWNDMAVFYRVNSMSRVLEEALRRAGVPYQIVRGVAFYQRREIKDMLAYLRLLVNDADEVSLLRIINTPTRGIGATTVKRMQDYARQRGVTMWSILEHPETADNLTAAARIKVGQFVSLIRELRAGTSGPVADVVRDVYHRTGLAAALGKERTEDPRQNVEELINDAVHYDETAEEPSLVDYLQQVSLVSDSDAYDAEAGAVSLMTLHAAKGLEFPLVIIVGLEDGVIPHARSLDSNSARDLEEERRLLFVGITRAQQRLLLTFARNRTVNGMVQAGVRSEFLRDMPSLLYHESAVVGIAGAAAADDFESGRDLGADGDPYACEDDPARMFRTNQRVRHPSLGPGRIVEVHPNGLNSKVVVQFTQGGRKTLVLKYARLEAIDYPV